MNDIAEKLTELQAPYWLTKLADECCTYQELGRAIARDCDGDYFKNWCDSWLDENSLTFVREGYDRECDAQLDSFDNADCAG